MSTRVPATYVVHKIMVRQVKIASLLFLFILLWCSFQYVEAFTPNAMADRAARLARYGGEVRSGTSSTHRSISSQAILKVSADLLTDNPNPDPEIDSTARINALKELEPDDLVEAYYGRSSRQQKSRYEDAIEEINEANEQVDTGREQTLAAAHFDSEQLRAGQNRLIVLREMVATEIQKMNYTTARMFAGNMLHTLQDFYSHTNWIELGRRQPNSVLGREGQQLQDPPSNTATCANCTTDGTVGRIVGYRGPPQLPMFYYRCENNILPGVTAGGILISGYYHGQIDGEGREIDKPAGKCSHGGFWDLSSDLEGTGGINKDSISLDWSPHAQLHDEAAEVAVQASVNLLQDIRRAVNDDTKFASFLNLGVVVTSIAYVIDTTGSMNVELPEIQATIPNIKTSLEDRIEALGGSATVRFILVPFNDPGI